MIPIPALDYPIRHQVAKDYCRTIAAIDDDIFESVEGRTLSLRFAALQRSCAEAGVLCHLHSYPKTSASPDDERAKQPFSSAVSTAKAADVVLLDWYLGSDQNSGNPDHAIRLLQELAATDPVRFVLIYTTESKDVVESKLKKVLPKLRPLTDETNLAIDAGDEDEENEDEENEDEENEDEENEDEENEDEENEDEENEDEENEDESNLMLISGDGDGSVPKGPEEAEAKSKITAGLRLDNRFFVFVGTKEDLKAEDLVDTVQGAMASCFTDHLKWAGLEMAVKTRALLPRIVTHLPDNTDNALVLQMLYQNEDEVAEQVGAVLVDELKAALRDDPLKTVCDETLVSHLRAAMAFLADPEQAELLETITSGLGSDYGAKRRAAWGNKNSGERLNAEENKLVEFQASWATADLAKIRKAMAKRKEIDKWFPHDISDQRASERQKRLDICQAVSCYLEGCSQTDNAVIAPSVAWATVCESVLLAPQEAVMRPGAILSKISGSKSDPQWVLCLTGSCDCRRNKNGFLVVAGAEKALEQISSDLEQTQTTFQLKEFVWKSSKLSVILDSNIRPPDAPGNAPTAEAAVASLGSNEEMAIAALAKDTEAVSAKTLYEVKGYLRQEFAMRLIHRVWTYQTRVGVDGAELLRQRRAE